MDGVKLKFNEDALDLIVDTAVKYKLGARGLRSIVESVMIDSMYEIPGTDTKQFTVTSQLVADQLAKSTKIHH